MREICFADEDAEPPENSGKYVDVHVRGRSVRFRSATVFRRRMLRAAALVPPTIGAGFI